MYDTPLEDSWQARLLAEEKAAKEFTNIKEKYVIDGNIDYPEPDYLIRIGDVPTLPKGNLVAVSAKWKNGKTFFCDILSAIFLGSDVFPNCESLNKQGKVRFIDTEQARNDTARILKTIRAMIPEERKDDIEVSCLRDADICSYNDDSDEVSRYEFVRRSIEIERPDLVIVDGIADLIYNYNEVTESQDMVNKLATLANKHNCCIVVVMHQNKGSHDKMMKGHIGTMLYMARYFSSPIPCRVTARAKGWFSNSTRTPSPRTAQPTAIVRCNSRSNRASSRQGKYSPLSFPKTARPSGAATSLSNSPRSTLSSERVATNSSSKPWQRGGSKRWTGQG